jgi:hypothetical protein
VAGEQVTPLYVEREDWKVCHGRLWMRFLNQSEVTQSKRGVEIFKCAPPTRVS